jgi:hypothetical protein
MEIGIRAIFAISGNYGTWGYSETNKFSAPYVGFLNRPFDKSYANQGGGPTVGVARDRYGFRLDSSDDPRRDLREKDLCEFRIFILGGSTVAGRALKGIDDTVPARLETLLNEAVDSKLSYVVINAGVGGFTSPQSLLQHIMYIRYTLRPNLIVHFNGSNDSVGSESVSPIMAYDGVEDNLHRHTERLFLSYAERGPTDFVLELVRTLADKSALMFVFHKTLTNPNSWKRYWTGSAVIKPNNNSQEFDLLLRRRVDRYIYNLSIATSLADDTVGVAYFLQPTLLPGFSGELNAKEKQYLRDGLDESDAFFGFDRYLAKRKFFELASKRLQRQSLKEDSVFTHVSDLSKLFLGKNKVDSFFSDHVHYSSEGRKLIAEELFDHLSPLIKILASQGNDYHKCEQ